MGTLTDSNANDEVKISNKISNKTDKLSSSVYVIFLVLIVDLLGFTVILPLLPSIFDYYASNENDHLYHWMEKKIYYFQDLFGSPNVFNTVLFGGFLGSVFSGLQFLVSPVFGALSDVYGRKGILLLSMFGIVCSHAIWWLCRYFYLFVLARIVGGLSRANISLCTAIVTDLCPEKSRGKGMAFIGIAFSIGFIVGPVIGAIFSSRKSLYFLPACFALSMSLLDVFLVLFFFQESLSPDKRAASIGQGLSDAYQFISPPSLFSFSPVLNIQPKEKKVLQQIGVIYFLFLFIYSGLEYSLSFLTHIRFEFTSMQQGKMYLFSGIIMIFIQGGYVRRIPPGKELRSAAMGAILIIPSFILIGLSVNVQMLYCGLALYAFASATVVPCLTTLASKMGAMNQKGTVLGIFRSLGSLARALGPFISAFGYWSLGPEFLYCMGALLLVVPMVLILNLCRNKSDALEKEE
ncbi:LOW QUALITY PROTEIN: major facilitator superfamily domain-containing protein 10-like [Uloborus diversus]|uniref:LOW QUALITY PROTEIN: major facilitator superfamily domain-containing protein 10-like n=1 Tax=Uloborus diversus TaxID=327109 RepID=UPI00240990E7|nr:LOW QUALITY PROTEIN: major facilitator superfamily domain-containing protein 10-like [Uloborus diversus]